MITFSIIQKSQLEGTMRLDAEYFQPEYLAIQNNLLQTKSYKLWREIPGKFITGPFGSEFNVENYIPNGEFRYVRGKDVKDFFVLENDNVYLPEADFKRLNKYALSNGDILISVVGTLGNAAIVDEGIVPAIFSCKSTVFRPEKINPFYFIAYLNSKYGKKLLERSVRGAVQTGLNIDDLKDLPVFIPSQGKQQEVGDIVQSAKKELENSKSFYRQVENFLLEELGLKDFSIDQSLFSIVNISDIKAAGRMDAEYFQLKYEKLISKIESQSHKRLGDLVSMKKGIEIGAEQYQDEGKLFIRVSSMGKFEINDSDQKYLSEKLYEKLKSDFQPKVGEILLTKDATPGIAYVLKENIDGIISGGTLRLKLKEKIESEYLALCLNSIIGQMQAERDAGGSVIAHWKPEQIKNVVIPILLKEAQQKIADLIRQSHDARKKAKELLNEAKRKVEEMIEKGGDI